MLAPGESKQVAFPLGFGELSYFDNEGRQIVTPSDYTVWIGGNSLASQNVTFKVTKRSSLPRVRSVEKKFRTTIFRSGVKSAGRARVNFVLKRGEPDAAS